MNDKSGINIETADMNPVSSSRGYSAFFRMFIILPLIAACIVCMGCSLSHTQQFPMDNPDSITVSMSGKSAEYPAGNIALKMLSGHAIQSVNSLVRRAAANPDSEKLAVILAGDRFMFHYNKPCKVSLHEKEQPADAVKDKDGFTVADNISKVLIPLDGDYTGQIIFIDPAGKVTMTIVPSISVTRQALAETLSDL